MQEINEEIIEILMEAPGDRKKNQIKILEEFFKNISFFQKFEEENGEENLFELLKHCYFEQIPKGEIIFEFDSFGKEFFIILEGICGVYSKTKYISEENDTEIRKLIVEEQSVEVFSDIHRIKSNFNGIPLTRKAEKSRVEFRENTGFVVYFRGRPMENVAKLNKGMTFGGLSLSEKNKNGRRGATVLAEEDTYCAVLDRDSFLV